MQQVINWSITSGGLIFAVLAFVVEKIHDCTIVLFWSWLVVWLFGILGISQYAGEAGRMLRASYYGRLIEAHFYYDKKTKFPLSLMWETYLSEDGNTKGWGSRRLSNSYRLSAFVALSGLVLFQFTPYLLASVVGSRCHPLQIWLALPIVGAITSFTFMAYQILTYIKKFPPRLNGLAILQAHNIQIQKTEAQGIHNGESPIRF